MNGVEILKETAIYYSILPVWLIILLYLWGFILLAVTVTAFCAYIKFGDKQDKSAGVISLITTLALLSASIVGMFPSSKIAYTEYTVILDDSVSFNEFTEKYEIIDNEGKIYTVKEK